MPPSNFKTRAYSEANRGYGRYLWYAVSIAILALIIAAMVLFFVPFLSGGVTNRMIAFAVLFGSMTAMVLYLRRRRVDYQNRPPMQIFYGKHRSRARYLLTFGAAFGFLFSGCVVGLLGHPLPVYYSVPLFFVFGGVGALFGDLIGKRRDYQVPFWP